ncbi:PDZ domain-containing protein [Paracidobacterium acidisoli]|uniref:PDZ domain-containing protein n=1 Tax=Paracidobacterium acidisoli TaxID=2303751 RepID=A0A372INT7_9BACT|nr:PDZ domain-containing protein [Paracidobacterium acidisoli]MBT9332082.1 PDZ domain-containing protein [Paracidobacterium acidisoli]
MKHLPRPIQEFALLALPGIFLALVPACAGAQHIPVDPNTPLFLISHAAQGYLGIDTRDVGTDRIAALKLKDTHGAEIVTVDHDAPAGKAGLRVHDVILQINGQPVESEAQFGHILHDSPPGRTITLLISRDGQQQTVSVQLGDRDQIEADAWPHAYPVPDQEDDSATPAATSTWAGSDSTYAASSGASLPGSRGFLGSFHIDPLYVGLELDPIGTQLAEYFGVHDGSGLLVHRVEDNSPASAAGLKAGDVITRVNGKNIATHSQWMKALHENRGKLIQVTVVRNRREQTVTMTAGQLRKKG